MALELMQKSKEGDGKSSQWKLSLYPEGQGPGWPCPPWTSPQSGAVTEPLSLTLPCWVPRSLEQGGKTAGSSVPPGGGGWIKLGSRRPAPRGGSGPLPMELADPGSLSGLPCFSLFPTWARTHPLEMGHIGVGLLPYLGNLAIFCTC